MSKNIELIHMTKNEKYQHITNFISEKFRDDEEVILEAIKTKLSNIKYASDRIKNDKQLTLKAIKSFNK